VPPLATG